MSRTVGQSTGSPPPLPRNDLLCPRPAYPPQRAFIAPRGVLRGARLRRPLVLFRPRHLRLARACGPRDMDDDRLHSALRAPGQQALHAKLDHLLDRIDAADGKMAGIDRMPPEDIEQFREAHPG